jgi:hypothetical protein
VPKEISETGLRKKSDKKPRRLDKPFNDAVRSRKASAITNVLLRADLSEELARRTTKKILATRRSPNS